MVDKDGNIPSIKPSILNKSIEEDLRDLYNQYIKIDFEWPVKFLANCRKINNTIEMNYICQLPLIRDCYKNGRIINVNEYLANEVDQYYAQIISAGSVRSFK